MNVVLLILRGVFILLLAAVGWHYVVDINRPLGPQTWLALALALSIAASAVCLDILAPRRKLTLFAGTFLGLIVGVAMSYALSFLIQLLIEQFVPLDSYVDANGFPLSPAAALAARAALESFSNLTIGGVVTYLAISFTLQTKDDFRFIIPYVEFRKQLRGNRPMLSTLR